MSFRLIAVAAMLLAPPSVAHADDSVPDNNICQQTRPEIRSLWADGGMDAPTAIAPPMVAAFDGYLVQVRRDLAALPPTDLSHWRQLAMLTALFAGHGDEAGALLDDGATANGTAIVPPLKGRLYHQMMSTMAPGSAASALERAGVAANRGTRYGPALSVAVICNDAASVNMLLARGAEPEPPRVGNIASPVEMAVLRGYTTIVRALLDYGADHCALDRRARQRAFDPGHRPITLQQIGRKRGLPASLVRRLACPTPAAS